MRTVEDDLFIDDEGVQPAEYQSDGDMGHISEAEEEQEDDEITRIFTQKKRKRTEKYVLSAATCMHALCPAEPDSGHATRCTQARMPQSLQPLSWFAFAGKAAYGHMAK